MWHIVCTFAKTVSNVNLYLYIIAIPEAPVSIATKDVKEDKLVLTWKPPKEDGGSKIETYHIKMKEEDGDWIEIAKVKSFEKDHKVENLKPGKSYRFAVTAENDVGQGQPAETTSPVIPKRKPGTKTNMEQNKIRKKLVKF